MPAGLALAWPRMKSRAADKKTSARSGAAAARTGARTAEDLVRFLPRCGNLDLVDTMTIFLPAPDGLEKGALGLVENRRSGRGHERRGMRRVERSSVVSLVLTIVSPLHPGRLDDAQVAEESYGAVTTRCRRRLWRRIAPRRSVKDKTRSGRKIGVAPSSSTVSPIKALIEAVCSTLNSPTTGERNRSSSWRREAKPSRRDGLGERIALAGIAELRAERIRAHD